MYNANESVGWSMREGALKRTSCAIYNWDYDVSKQHYTMYISAIYRRVCVHFSRAHCGLFCWRSAWEADVLSEPLNGREARGCRSERAYMKKSILSAVAALSLLVKLYTLLWAGKIAPRENHYLFCWERTWENSWVCLFVPIMSRLQKLGQTHLDGI